MKLKTKMTLWFSLMMVLLCTVLLAVLIRTSDKMQSSTAQKTLIRAILANNDANYYTSDFNPFEFISYINGVYSQVYSEDGSEMRAGMQPFADPIDIAPLLSLAEANGRTGYPYFGKSTIEGTRVYWCMVWLSSSSYFATGEMTSDEMASDEMTSGEMASGEMSVDTTDETETEIAGVWLCGMLPADSMENMMDSVIRAAEVVLPVLVLLSALGAWFIAAQSLRPLERITAAADEISSGDDLSRRLSLKKGRDEVHRLADTFNGMFERLERSFLAERQFTADASHELRTPVAIILAECEMAEKSDADRAELAESLAVIRRQSRKMSTLIAKLLSYTRLEQGTQKTDMGELDLADLTRAVCADQQALAGSTPVIVCDADASVPVTGDIALLTSLLQNLVSNAVKYARETIRVSVTTTDGQALITVSDDGAGIAPDKLPFIFNRFYQADPARSHADGSLGLGLCIARQIARLHKGELRAESTPGEGSRFTFSMPL